MLNIAWWQLKVKHILPVRIPHSAIHAQDDVSNPFHFNKIQPIGYPLPNCTIGHRQQQQSQRRDNPKNPNSQEGP